MTEEEDAEKKLIDAWKKKQTTEIIRLLTSKPDLFEHFDLVESKPKMPFYKRHRVFVLSIPISLLIGFVLMASYHLLFPLLSSWDFLWVLLVFAFMLFLLSLCLSCLVSLRPLGLKSLSLPFYLSGFSSFFAVFTYELTLGAPLTLPSFTSFLAVAFVAGAFAMFIIGGPTSVLTRKIIGLPRCDEPIKISLKIKSDVDTFLNALSDIFRVHLFFLVKPKSLSQVPQKRFAKYEASEFIIAIEIHNFPDTNEYGLKALFYQEGGEAVIADEFCKDLMEEIVGDIRARLKTEPWPKVGYSELFEYALGHTRSKIQPFVDHLKSLVVRMPKFAWVAILVGIVLSYLAIANWNLVMQWKDTLAIIGSLLTIISVIVGWIVLRKKRLD